MKAETKSGVLITSVDDLEEFFNRSLVTLFLSGNQRERLAATIALAKSEQESDEVESEETSAPPRVPTEVWKAMNRLAKAVGILTPLTAFNLGGVIAYSTSDTDGITLYDWLKQRIQEPELADMLKEKIQRLKGSGYTTQWGQMAEQILRSIITNAYSQKQFDDLVDLYRQYVNSVGEQKVPPQLLSDLQLLETQLAQS